MLLSRTYRGRILASAALCFCLVGCGSGDIGRVTGKVTADGKPLANALVEFFPESGGRRSFAMTDSNGAYELTYSRDENGAEVGEHLVRITTGGMSEGDYGKPSKETLPSKYNANSELKKMVKPGSNVIDFELDYEGEIVQPVPESGY